MSDWEQPLIALLELQRRFERGPKREGAFALWLTTRVAIGVGFWAADAEKPHRRRLALLRLRLQPLVVPRTLEKGLATALLRLEECTPAAARIALTQLVAPTRDALGQEAADAVASAARLVHERGLVPERG